MEANCLKCVKWDDGKGLEVVYQEGIFPAIQIAENVIRYTKDKILMGQMGLLDHYLHEADKAIVGFQGELGLLKDDEETAT